MVQPIDNYTLSNFHSLKWIVDSGAVQTVSKQPEQIVSKTSLDGLRWAKINDLLSPFMALRRNIPYYNIDKKRTEYKFGLIRELTPAKVIFNPPATIVFWENGDKTVVKCGEGEIFDKEKGLAMAFCKRVWGNTGRFNDMFTKWCFDEKAE